ncbi:hypothetical protein, partial [Haloferax volcanii]|uniref:hypothetical protein n=1 Tax=Haloferax volcanii TaxID=2246 RepID=UPI0019D32F1A
GLRRVQLLDTVRLVVGDEGRRQREVTHAHLSQRWRRTHISIFAGGEVVGCRSDWCSGGATPVRRQTNGGRWMWYES